MTASNPVALANPIETRVSPDLQHEIEQFLYYEAAVLDDRRFEEWLRLLAPDIHYYMPTRYNRMRREMDDELSHPDQVAHFDDDLGSLKIRVKRLRTGQAWAEDPPSRTRHLVSNVQIRAREKNCFEVQCCFYVYRSRLEREVENFVGGREDILRRRNAAPGWEIVKRTIVLDQTVVLAKNISFFF